MLRKAKPLQCHPGTRCRDPDRSLPLPWIPGTSPGMTERRCRLQGNPVAPKSGPLFNGIIISILTLLYSTLHQSRTGKATTGANAHAVTLAKARVQAHGPIISWVPGVHGFRQLGSPAKSNTSGEPAVLLISLAPLGATFPVHASYFRITRTAMHRLHAITIVERLTPKKAYLLPYMGNLVIS